MPAAAIRRAGIAGGFGGGDSGESDALAMGLKSGAVEKADLREAAELLRALVGADERGEMLPNVGSYNEWFDLAREFRRVMRKA